MITILGASGNIGSKIARTLLAEGKAVRVIGRDPSRLRELAEKGAQVRVGDLQDAKFLAEALKGSEAVFALIPPSYAAPSFLDYARKVGESIVEAVRAAGVRRVVNLSSLGAEHELGTGPIRALHAQEQRLNRLEGVDVLHLRPTYFLENLLANVPLIRQQGILGSAIRGDVSLPMIATQDIAAVAARRLADGGFRGKSVELLLGERDLTHDEVARVVGEILGRKLSYVAFDPASTRAALVQQGFSADVAGLFVEMSEAFNSGRVSGKGLRTEANTTPTRVEEFARVFKQLAS